MMERQESQAQTVGRFNDDTTQTATDNEARNRYILATGSVLGAVLASSCCIVPLLLFMLGISGAWISNLTALTPYKPYFIMLTLIFLTGGFFMAYLKPKVACEPGSYCAVVKTAWGLKAILWGAALLVAAALAFPYAAPYLLN